MALTILKLGFSKLIRIQKAFENWSNTGETTPILVCTVTVLNVGSKQV